MGEWIFDELDSGEAGRDRWVEAEGGEVGGSGSEGG